MSTPLISLFASGHRGGIMRTTCRLANAFTSFGYRVHLILPGKELNIPDQINQGVQIRGFPTFHLLTGVLPLGSYLLRYQPTVILTGVYQHAILALRSRSFVRSPCRIYAAVRNPYSREWEHVSDFKRRRRVSRIRKYYPRADGIIANSEDVALDFSSLTGISCSGITTIPNPAFDSSILTHMLKPVDHPWFEETQPQIVLTVGRLEKQKNHHLLIDAFEDIRPNIHCRLVIIGEGTLGPELRSRAARSPYSKDIEFLGHVANPFPYMHRASVFVLSSLWEGFGNVLVEALATGTPVVSTDCPGGPREILNKVDAGKLVPVNDSQAMAQAVMAFLKTPLDRGGVMTAAERFSADAVARDYLELFDLENPGFA